LVIILPAEENMRSGTAKVEGTRRTFLPKRAIHGTTEEARLNSFRGFLCDGITCRCILQKAISSSVMSELDLLRGREVSGGSLSYIEESSRRCSSGTSRKCHRAQSKRTVQTRLFQLVSRFWTLRVFVFLTLFIVKARVGRFFLARNICTTTFSHHLLVRSNRHLSDYPVSPSC